MKKAVTNAGLLSDPSELKLGAVQRLDDRAAERRIVGDQHDGLGPPGTSEVKRSAVGVERVRDAVQDRDQGGTEVTCQFCGHKYRFAGDDILALTAKPDA